MAGPFVLKEKEEPALHATSGQPSLQDGFMQPAQKTSGMPAVQAKASNAELDAQLSILKNPNATDDDKIFAARKIGDIFSSSGATLAQVDTAAALRALIDCFVLPGSNPSVAPSVTLKANLLVSENGIFASGAPRSAQDIGGAITFLHGIIVKDGEDSSIRSTALWNSGYLLSEGGSLLTAEQRNSITSDICNVLKDPNPPGDLLYNAELALILLYDDSAAILIPLVQGPSWNEERTKDMLARFDATTNYNSTNSFIHSAITFGAFVLGQPVADSTKGSAVSLLDAAISISSARGMDAEAALGEKAVFDTFATSLVAYMSSGEHLGLLKVSFGGASGMPKLMERAARDYAGYLVPMLQNSDDALKLISLQILGSIWNGSNQSSQDSTAFFSALPHIAEVAASAFTPQNIKLFAGSIVSEVCFKYPYFLDQPDYGNLLHLDSQTARRMIAASPDWQKTTAGIDDTDDYHMIYALASSRPEPIAKALFESPHEITYFGQYPQRIIESLYDNRNALTGQPVWVVLNTKEKGTIYQGFYEEAHFGAYLKPEYADSHDVRIFEKKTDTAAINSITDTLQQLGLKPARESADAAKRIISIGGHGTPSQTLLSDFQQGAAPESNTIDVDDKALFRELRAYFEGGSAFFESCSVGGGSPFSNLAYEFARDTGTRTFAPQTAASSGPRLSWKNGVLEDVNYSDILWQSVPRSMYDFRKVSSLALVSSSVTRTSNGIQISFSDKSGNAFAYIVEKLVNGNFETVGIIDGKAGTRDYNFAANDSGEAATFRVMRADSTDGVVPGSKNYTFSVSASLLVGESREHAETVANAGKFRLEQNYPNPARKNTTIEYWLPEWGQATLKVYNTLGQLVATLVDNETRLADTKYSAELDVSKLASGVYFYTLQAKGHSETKKMMVVK